MSLLAAALVAVVPGVALPADPAPTAAGCLPGGTGYLEMRLRGSLEADLRWQGAELACTGMSRPDGRGLRLHFTGRVPGAGELAVVFAAAGLAEGESARSVPVNVTLMDQSAGRIYGTRGPDRCMLDEISQQPVSGDGLPPRSFRVLARGYCTEPARALDGAGSVLLTRFDFVGLVTWREDDGAPPVPEAA